MILLLPADPALRGIPPLQVCQDYLAIPTRHSLPALHLFRVYHWDQAIRADRHFREIH